MSYALYIGRDHTADGLAYLGGYGDEPSSHWLEVVERAQHAPGSTVTVGVTAEAEMPGLLTEIPEAAETARHVRVSYSYYKGVPAPLTNGGLNEYGVAVRDVWSNSRVELVAMTPPTQRGPNYSDLARLVLRRARTARQGVDLIASLISEHGYSDYGGNSHLIADATEAWVVIEFSGGQGLWAAERLGPQSIRASRPGYIGVVPVDQSEHPDFLYSPNLVSFAQAQGWYAAGTGTPFDVNLIYGDGKGPWAGVQWIESEMRQRASRPQKIAIEDMFWAVRTEKLTGDTAGYGQVVPLLGQVAPELRVLWHTQTGAVAAPFVPVYLGMQQVPEEFRQHRYLTDGEASRFLDLRHARNGRPDTVSLIPQGIESTRSASAECKRLLNLLMQHSDQYLEPTKRLWEAAERRLLASQAEVVDTAATLIGAGKVDLACNFLTYYCNNELLRGLELVSTQARSLEAQTRLLHGFASELEPRVPPQIW